MLHELSADITREVTSRCFFSGGWAATQSSLCHLHSACMQRKLDLTLHTLPCSPPLPSADGLLVWPCEQGCRGGCRSGRHPRAPVHRNQHHRGRWEWDV